MTSLNPKLRRKKAQGKFLGCRACAELRNTFEREKGTPSNNSKKIKRILEGGGPLKNLLVKKREKNE